MSTETDPPFSEEQMVWLRETFARQPPTVTDPESTGKTSGEETPASNSGKRYQSHTTLLVSKELVSLVGHACSYSIPVHACTQYCAGVLPQIHCLPPSHFRVRSTRLLARTHLNKLTCQQVHNLLFTCYSPMR